MAMYSCGYYRENFSSISELKRHIVQEKRKQEYTYTCALISAAKPVKLLLRSRNTFKDVTTQTLFSVIAAALYALHWQRHVRSFLSFQCDYCDKKYKRQCSLTVQCERTLVRNPSSVCTAIGNFLTGVVSKHTCRPTLVRNPSSVSTAIVIL